MPKFVKGSSEAREFMASLRAKRKVGGSFCPATGGSFCPATGGSFCPATGGGFNLKNTLEKDIWNKIPEPYHPALEKIGTQVIKDAGFGLGKKPRKVRGGRFNLKDTLQTKIWDKISPEYHQPLEDIGKQVIKDVGFGLAGQQHVCHHHYHHYQNGKGMWDWADPKKNGVEKAFDPNQNGISKAFDPKQNGIDKLFVPGGQAEEWGRQFGRTGIPIVTGAITGAASGFAGGPVAGVAGTIAGNMAGQYLVKKTGVGLKKGGKTRIY